MKDDIMFHRVRQVSVPAAKSDVCDYLLFILS